MAPFRPASTIHMVTSILLLLNIAYASVLPSNQPYLPDAIAARTPDEDVPTTHDVEEVPDASSDKKDGKNFFKELGHFLSEFDPADIFRTILGGLLGSDDAGAATSPSPSTTVTIAPTPNDIGGVKGPLPAVLSTAKTTITKTVTTTQARKSSTKTSSSKKSSTSADAIFSILPIFPTEEPLELTGLAPTAFPTPNHIILTPIAAASFGAAISADADVSVDVLPLETESLIVFPGLVNASHAPNATGSGITVTFEPEETFAILPFIEPGKNMTDNVTLPDFPSPTDEIAITGPFGLPTAPAKSISDSILPATAEEIPPLETFEVVTTPVTDVPEADLLPVPTEETFSILPFFEPGEHLSDNVSEATPTEEIPKLLIPVFTGSGESLNPFAGEDVTISAPEDLEPLQTNRPDFDDRAPVPLLEFVNGTYVLPTTKKPDVVTPVLSWPPPGFNATSALAISTRRASPWSTSSRRRARPTRPPVPSLLIPRPTKPILLPPPLIRPTNFPLNQTFFANQTKGAVTPVANSSRPLILTNPLRATLEPLPITLPRPVPLPRPIRPFPPFPFPIFNNTRGLRPIGRPTRSPTRPLILTNPLRTTPESFPTFKPVLNSTTFVRPTRPLILTNPLRPPIETFEPLDAGKTTTKTLKIRSTVMKTVIVIPTPAAVEVSMFGVDVPSDEPLPSDAGFVGLPLFEEASLLSENPRPTFPIIDDFGTFDLTSEAVRPSYVPGGGDFVEEDVPSDLVEPTDVSVVDDLSTTVALPFLTTTSSEIELSFPDAVNYTSKTVDIGLPVEATEIPIPEAVPETIDIVFGEEATASLEPSLDIPEPTDFDDLPIFTPTPTPRTLATVPSVLPSIVTLALPTEFPLPQPGISTTDLSSSPSTQRLAEICADKKVTTVTLPLLSKWYGPNAYPSLRAYPGCIAANPRQATQAPGLLNCTALGREVQACQKAGKRVLLGVRVDTPSAVNGNLKWGSASSGLLGLKLPLALPPGPFLGRPGHPLVPAAGNLTSVKVDGKTVPAPNLFDAAHTPTGLAATLFSLFGEGHGERADLRPLGPDAPSAFISDKIEWVVKPLGEEVVVDGFDVRTPGQWKGTAQAALVERFVGSLREDVEKAWKDGGGKKGGLNDMGVDGMGVVVSGYI
ncbi:hypothetical protein PMIN03_002144 [Paraphaeosphaeria minitans]